MLLVIHARTLSAMTTYIFIYSVNSLSSYKFLDEDVVCFILVFGATDPVDHGVVNAVERL